MLPGFQSGTQRLGPPFIVPHGPFQKGFLPQEFESWSAHEKMSYVWTERILASRYSSLPAWRLSRHLGSSLFALSRTYRRHSDELPQGRPKIFHPLGSVACVEFVAHPDTPFTGLFKGSVGLIRLSLAADPGLFGFIPGLALKLYRDGFHSDDLVAIHSMDPQVSLNFFELPFSTILPEPKSLSFLTAVKLYRLSGVNPLETDVTPFALRSQSGLAEPVASSPWEMVFKPATQVKNYPVFGKKFREHLTCLPQGLSLYNVYGRNRFSNDADIFMGTIKLLSPFVSSRYGDEQLFFKHYARKYT